MYIAALISKDVVQEALVDITRGIAGYRWQASFMSWCHAIATRRAAREGRRSAARAERLLELLEETIAGPQDPFEADEAVLVEQSAGLACAFVVAHGLRPQARRAYLLGEVLGVTDRVGASCAGAARPRFASA
jgi:DNA-directed RNA polymerase specialized sigma24 family protein